jgi:hypothetical protein
MKSFYEMLRILESEEVKTPGGYVLSPDELEDYEREKSSVYKALFLKNIDDQRKKETERSPDAVAKREMEIRRQEEQKSKREEEERMELQKIKEKERYKMLPPAEKYDYIVKAYGILLKAFLNGSACCKQLLNVIEGPLKKQGSEWRWSYNRQTKESLVVEPYSGSIGSPKYDRDVDEIYDFLSNMMVNYDLFVSKNKKFCDDLNNALYKMGVKPIYKVGDVVNFREKGSFETPLNSVERGDKVRVVKGYYPADEFRPNPTFDGGLVWETPKGNAILFRALVEKA